MVACALEALAASGPAVCGALVAVVASHRSPPLGSQLCSSASVGTGLGTVPGLLGTVLESLRGLQLPGLQFPAAAVAAVGVVSVLHTLLLPRFAPRLDVEHRPYRRHRRRRLPHCHGLV